MKKTMFKRIFAGIAAMFMMCLCLPMCSMEFMPNAEPNTEAEDEWLDMYRIKYKIKDRDTLIINENSDASIELSDFYFKSYAADIKHLQIGKGWKIYSFRNLTAIESLTIGDNCTIGANAFYGCAALESVKIGENCIIYENAFYRCSNISNADCKKSTIVIKSGNPEIIQNCGHECNHTLDNSLTCTICGYKCVRHSWDSRSGKCSLCGYECKHPSYYIGLYSICKTCSYSCKHPSYSDGKCTVCGCECSHEWWHSWDSRSSKCSLCGYECSHVWHNDKCRLCGMQRNNTASTFSDGSVLVIVGGSAFLILCGLAAVIIVKRRKKTQ